MGEENLHKHKYTIRYYINLSWVMFSTNEVVDKFQPINIQYLTPFNFVQFIVADKCFRLDNTDCIFSVL